MLRPMRMRSSAAGLVCAVLLAGCGTGGGADLSTTDARGGPSCEERALDAPPDSAIDWANYLRWEDRVYTAKRENDPAVVPDAQLGSVTCTRSGSRTPVNHVIAEHEAAYLEVGTPFHSIAGRSPEAALTAVLNGQRLVFAFDAMLTDQLLEAQRPASDVLRVDAADLSGATVCKAETSVDLPDQQCRDLTADAARRIAAALDGAPPYGAGPECLGDAPVYEVVLAHPSVKPVPIVIHTACGPVSVGKQRYRLSDEVASVVTREHDRAH